MVNPFKESIVVFQNSAWIPIVPIGKGNVKSWNGKWGKIKQRILSCKSEFVTLKFRQDEVIESATFL